MDPPTSPYDIDGTGDPNTRLNIDDFSTNDSYKIRWGLFLRALGQLQLAPITDPLGYYRIAGVHGWPLVTWPDLQAQAGKTIYCSHGTTRFPTWHRPYLLLLEQRIVEIAVTLAALAPDNLKQEYNTEALQIRIPYWDWAYIPALPAAAVNEDAYVIIPELDPVNPTRIDNPMYSYRFTGPSMPPVDGPTTTRYPDDTVKSNLIGANLRTLVYHALTSVDGYAPFSNTLYSPPGSPIEQPHNLVHDAISRVMGEAMVTAFDPIFWVFHSVMDRYYALWQTINPTVPYGENHEGANTIDEWLAPFNRSIGAWTSRMVQKSDSPNIPNTWVFGYQYPETLVEWTDKQRQDAVWAAIAKYYAPMSPDSKQYPPGAIHRGERLNQPGYPTDLPDEASIRREWKVLIKVKNNLVAGNFAVFVFLGDSGENSEEWGRHPNTAGSVSTFKAALESCSNCQAKEGDYMYGSVYLTDKLHDVLPRGTRLENQVALTSWLSNKLDWRIRQADGTEVHLAAGDTTSLSVGVESFMEAYAPIDKNGNPIDCDLGKILGRTFDHVKHPDITAGKANKGGDTLSS